MNNRVRAEVGHRVLPHTADVIVEAWAPSRSGCLEELVRGVGNLEQRVCRDCLDPFNTEHRA